MAYKLYHEKQEAALCGVHCLNALLQGPYINEWDLASIAHEFDEMEAQLMGQQGLDTPEYLKFAAEGSGNVARDGMFSIQVLQKALSNWDLSTQPITHPEMMRYAMEPTKAAGYICNLSEHWFTIRPVHGQWWNFNSLLPAPQMVGLVYLDTYLKTLRNENWTIYVVQGTVPIEADTSNMNTEGLLWTPEEAKRAHETSTAAKKRAKGVGIMEDLLQTAKAAGGLLSVDSKRHTTSTAHGVTAGSQTDMQGMTEEEQLAIAMQESLAGRAGPSGAVQSHQGLMASHSMDEDPELAHAIAASLASMQESSSGAGPSTSTGHQGKMQNKLNLVSHPVECTSYVDPNESAVCSRAGGVNDEVGENTAATAGEPDDETMVDLVVKLPDNKRVKETFRRADRVAQVILWLQGQGCKVKKHRLCRSYPKEALNDTYRLQDAGVQAREMLFLERIP